MIRPIGFSQYNICLQNNVNFGAGWPNPDLKKLWDKGKLPTVKYGFYGDVLTSDTLSREHLQPASLGGTKDQFNIVLASKKKNNRRGNRDINMFATIEDAKRYLAQFIDVKTKGFNGNKYIKGIVATLRKLGMNLS